jgi:DNA repair exonuclease SbcCD nuclease subunit
MERTRRSTPKGKAADAILVSDLHLTDITPVSRMDDYLSAQVKKLSFLQSLSRQNNHCPVLCAGDVFDYWKASPWLCAMAYMYLPRPFIGIPGQHDLPMHSLALYERSALSLLDNTDENIVILGAGGEKGRKFILPSDDIFVVGAPFGALEDFNPEELLPIPQKRKILLLHELIWKGEAPPWGKNGWTDTKLFERFGKYFDLILTGDNHDGFISWEKNCIIVNSGSMLRINADQERYKPRCHLYYADENEVVPVYFPIEKEVHNQEHIERKKGRDERIAAYVRQMKGDWELGASFKKNLEAFFIENETPQKIKDVILWHLEAEKI